MLASPVGERMLLRKDISMDTVIEFGLRIVRKDQTLETEAVENCNPSNENTTNRMDCFVRSGMGGFFLEDITRNQTKNAKKIEVQLDPKCFRGNKDLKVPCKT
jgi:hypothetical protein